MLINLEILMIINQNRNGKKNKMTLMADCGIMEIQPQRGCMEGEIRNEKKYYLVFSYQ